LKSDGLRRYSAASGWWLGERVVVVLINLLVQLLLVRTLGAIGFGELAYLLAINGLLIPVTQTGIAGVVSRAIVDSPDSEKAIIETALYWRLLAASAASFAGAVYVIAGVDQLDSPLAIVSMIVISQLSIAFHVIENRYHALVKPSEFVPWRLVVTVASAATKIVVAINTTDTRCIFATFAAEHLLQAIAQSTSYRLSTGIWLWPSNNSSWTSWLFKRAPWLMASSIAETIYLKVDIVMLKFLTNTRDTGLYSAAAKISEFWYFIPATLMSAWTPLLWPKDRPPSDSSQQAFRTQQLLDLMALTSITIAIVIQIIGEPLVVLFFGAEFTEAGALLKIHVWAGVFIFMRAVLSKWLIMSDRLKYSLVSHGAGALSNVSLNLAVIPTLGATGAAIATAVSYAISSWIFLYCFPETRPLGRMMGRALLIPFRWQALHSYYALWKNNDH
jgi:PST family polysaccharide transporter